MADKYDRQIAELVALDDDGFVREVDKQWATAKGLFDFVPGTQGQYCLTMFRHRFAEPQNETQREIAADKKLPVRVKDITKASLPRFAYWQRRLRRRKAKT